MVANLYEGGSPIGFNRQYVIQGRYHGEVLGFFSWGPEFRMRDYVTSPNIRRTSIRLSRRSANLKRICESQPSEPFRVSRAGSVPSWPHSVRKNVPITSDMQATLLHDRNPL